MFNSRAACKQLQSHKPTIDTIVVTRKDIIRMSKIAQMAGCKLSLSYHLHNKEKKKRYKENHWESESLDIPKSGSAAIFF